MPDSKRISSIEIGTRVKALRESQNESQEKLAQSLNVSRELISKIESGRQFPSVIALARLSDYYGVSADHILFGVCKEKELTQQIDRVIASLKAIRKCL